MMTNNAIKYNHDDDGGDGGDNISHGDDDITGANISGVDEYKNDDDNVVVVGDCYGGGGDGDIGDDDYNA